jgi:predicted nucleotidyltransferase
MVSMTDIQALADRIAREFDPEKIILFGSYARGTSGPDSDIDLLVILSHPGKNWRKAAEIRGRVQSRFPLDLLVRLPEEVQRRVTAGDPFLRDIAKWGVVLHARDHKGMD